MIIATNPWWFLKPWIIDTHTGLSSNDAAFLLKCILFFNRFWGTDPCPFPYPLQSYVSLQNDSHYWVATQLPWVLARRASVQTWETKRTFCPWSNSALNINKVRSCSCSFSLWYHSHRSTLFSISCVIDCSIREVYRDFCGSLTQPYEQNKARAFPAERGESLITVSISFVILSVISILWTVAHLRRSMMLSLSTHRESFISAGFKPQRFYTASIQFFFLHRGIREQEA